MVRGGWYDMYHNTQPLIHDTIQYSNILFCHAYCLVSSSKFKTIWMHITMFQYQPGILQMDVLSHIFCHWIFLIGIAYFSIFVHSQSSCYKWMCPATSSVKAFCFQRSFIEEGIHAPKKPSIETSNCQSITCDSIEVILMKHSTGQLRTRSTPPPPPTSPFPFPPSLHLCTCSFPEYSANVSITPAHWSMFTHCFPSPQNTYSHGWELSFSFDPLTTQPLRCKTLPSWTDIKPVSNHFIHTLLWWQLWRDGRKRQASWHVASIWFLGHPLHVSGLYFLSYQYIRYWLYNFRYSWKIWITTYQ